MMKITMMMLKGQSWRGIRSSLGLSFDAPAAFTKTMTITDDLMWQQTALTVTIASPATGIKRRFAMDTPTKILYEQYVQYCTIQLYYTYM